MPISTRPKNLIKKSGRTAMDKPEHGGDVSAESSQRRRQSASVVLKDSGGSCITNELNNHPGHLLRRAQQIVVASFYDNVGRDSLTPLQYALLVALDENPGVDQVTLAKLVALDNSTTAETAVRLEAKGLIVRELYIEKRRQRRLSLTSLGRQVLQGLQSNIEDMKNQLLGRLAPGDQEQFLRLLRDFVNVENTALDEDSLYVTGGQALPQAVLKTPKNTP